MRATVMDLRRNPKKILDAIARNETVTLSFRGREVADIVPKQPAKVAIEELDAVGMWADHPALEEPEAYVRNLRQGRFDAL